jgi:hypothetical protein
VTLFEPTATPTDQSTDSDSDSNVSGALRKLGMVAVIAGFAYLALRRSRGQARSGERIRNRVAAAVETGGIRTDGSTERGQPKSGGVGVPDAASDGDSGSVEGSVSAAETGGTVDETGRTDESGPVEDEPTDAGSMADEPMDDEPVEGAETAVDEMEDADEHPTEPGTMDVDRDVVEEAVDDETESDGSESDDRAEE